MKINIWAAGKQFDFTHKQARAVYDELRELFDPKAEQPSGNYVYMAPDNPGPLWVNGTPERPGTTIP